MIIGLTGGIGSGKTTVSDYLEEKGFNIIDADLVSRQLTEKNGVLVAPLQKAFGDDIAENGVLNRTLLRERAFSSDANRLLLNSITHGAILEEIKARIATTKDEIIVLVAPLLFEVGIDSLCDEVWLVSVNDDERLKRVVHRDNCSEEQVKRIISAQMPDDEKKAKANVVIDNNNDLQGLYCQIDVLLKKILKNN